MARLQLDAVLRVVDISINPAVFKRISQATASMPKNVRLTSAAAKQLNVQMAQVNRTTQATSKSMVGMNRAAKTFLQRMAQFAVLLPTFATLNRAIQGGAKFLVDFETEMAKIVRIDPTNLRDRMDEIAASAFDTAQAFGSTADKVIQTIRIFKQAGDDISEAQDKARVATFAATVTTLELVQAQELLIAVSKQFADQGLTNADVLDKVTKIEDSAAVTAQDLAEALRTGGNALSFAAKSFDDTLGLIAGLREQTRKSGREVGTFFKTLSTRIFAAGDARSAVEGLGVSVANLDGSLRPLLPVLQDLSAAFDGLTESETASAAKSIAGIRQFESLIGTLRSLNRAQELSTKVSNAQGTAQKQLGVTSETLEFQLNQMIASFQEFAQTAGESGLMEIFKEVVGFASEIASGLQLAVKFADKLGVAIAPLLAVGAIKLGKSIFGAGGGGAGGPLGAASAGTAKQVQMLGKAAGTSAAQMMGMQSGLTAAQKKRKSATLQAAKSLGMLVIGTAVAAGLNAWADSIDDSTDAQKDYTAETLRNAGAAAQTAATFSLLGPKLGVFAGMLTAVVTSVNTIREALKEEEIARKEFVAGLIEDVQRATLIGKGGELGVFDAIIKAFENEIAASGGLTSTGIANIEKELRPLIESIESLKGLSIKEILALPELTAAIGRYDTSLQSLNDAMQNGVRGTALFSKFIADIVTRVNGATQAADHFIDSLTVVATSLERIDELNKVAELERELAEQRLELASVTQSTIHLFSSEVAEREKELAVLRQLPSVAQKASERLIALATSAPEAVLQMTKPIASRFMSDVITAFSEAGGKASDALDTVLAADQLLPQQKKFAKDLITALKEEQAEELAIRTATFDLREAQAKQEFERQKALSEVARHTAEMFDGLRMGMVELGVGTNAMTSDLEALQNLSITDFRAILDGTSELGENIQNAVQAAAGDKVAQAEADITAASETARVALEALRAELADTEAALGDIKDGFNQVTGESDTELLQKAAELRSAIAEKQGKMEIDLAKLGINRVQAIQEAEEEAAKKARELQDALDELANAERDVAKEAKDVSRAFQDFIDSKIADFSSDDADAQGALKDAQQEVLSSTEELADSYSELNQAILDFNDNMSSAVVESNLLGVQIQQITGGITTFQGRLAGLQSAFSSVLNDANISLSQRIDLERQFAQETLTFLQSARAEITSAGLDVFGQTGQENQALSEGIAGLSFIAEKLGGSFENFLDIDPGEFNKLSNELLNLPVEFRQKILDALGTLPSTTSIGGFSVEQLQTAIGQIGSGISPEEGLPSVEELIEQETAQIEELRDLAIKDAELQLATVISAQEQVDLAKAQLDEAQIMRERAEEDAVAIREAILEEKAVLDAANEQRQLLTDQILAATSDQALEQIQAQAEKFAEQNSVFRDVGDSIVQSIESLAAVQAQAIAAAASIPAGYGGRIPHFGRGNLSSKEAAGLLRAAAREKRHMPTGAGLAVANTSEAIIPMRNKGYIPNFQEGNISPIAAGVSAAKGINETVVAAISRSVGEAIADVVGGEGGVTEGNRQTVDVLNQVLDELRDISDTNTSISSNTDPAEVTGGGTTQNAGDLNVSITTNQRDTVQVTGLDGLVDQLREGIRRAQEDQAGAAVQQLEGVVSEIGQVLRERGIISSLGQPG